MVEVSRKGDVEMNEKRESPLVMAYVCLQSHDNLVCEEDRIFTTQEQLAKAQIYAAIAQAEQLKRIADMMEADRQQAKIDREAAAYVAQVKYGR